MAVFGSMDRSNTGAPGGGGGAPLAELMRRFPALAQYAGPLGLTDLASPATLYGYSTMPPVLFQNQPSPGQPPLMNTPPILEGIDPNVGESITAQMAAGNPNLGASVALENVRAEQRGQRGNRPGPQGPPVGLPAVRPASLIAQIPTSAPSAPAGPPAAPAPAPVPLPPGSPGGVPLPGPSGAPGDSGPGGGDGTGVGAPTGTGTGVGTGPGGAPGAAGPGIGEGGSGPGSGVGAPGTGVGGDSSGGTGGSGTGGGVGTGPGGGPGAAGPGIGEGPGDGGGGGGGAGGKVVCDALHANGYLDSPTWAADEAFAAVLAAIRPDILRGYHRWAKPLAGWMARWPVLAAGVALVARPWTQEMAYVMGARHPLGGPVKGSLVGRAMMHVGLRICARLGQEKSDG